MHVLSRGHYMNVVLLQLEGNLQHLGKKAPFYFSFFLRLLFFSLTHCKYLTYPGGPSPLAKREHVALITVRKVFKDHDFLYETLFVQLTYICPCKVHGKKEENPVNFKAFEGKKTGVTCH